MKSWIDYTFENIRLISESSKFFLQTLLKREKAVMLVSSLSEPPKNFLIYPNQHRKRKQNYLHSLGIFQVAVNSICYFFRI